MAAAGALISIVSLGLSFRPRPHRPVIHQPVVLKSVAKQYPREAKRNPLVHTHVSFSLDVPLQPIVKEGAYIFRGRLTCEGVPCDAADIQIGLETTNITLLTQRIHPDSEGRYETEFSLSKMPQEPLNWTIHFVSSNGLSQDIQGRPIMTDDRTVTVERYVNLRSNDPSNVVMVQ